MDNDRILTELMALAGNPESDLLQFRTLVSARQYCKLYDLIATHLPKDARVLDWGCGNGHASYALNALGHEVVGYTLNIAPRIAHAIPKVTFVTASADDPRSLPFDDASFDAALSVGVLEHVRETGGDELDSLRELGRVLRPGGILICYHFPNRFSYLEALARFLPGSHHHAFRFTPADVRSLCASAGFGLVATGRYGALPRNPWQSILPRIANSRWLADAWDKLDAIGERIVPGIVQNHYFVARSGHTE